MDTFELRAVLADKEQEAEELNEKVKRLEQELAEAKEAFQLELEKRDSLISDYETSLKALTEVNQRHVEWVNEIQRCLFNFAYELNPTNASMGLPRNPNLDFSSSVTGLDKAEKMKSLINKYSKIS